jgi:hypothetical protein
MAKKITIDLERLQNDDGSYNERDLETIQKATGRPYAEALKKADEDSGLTAEQIKKMSDNEYEENRNQILQSMNK